MDSYEWDVFMTHWAWRFTDAHVFRAFIQGWSGSNHFYWLIFFKRANLVSVIYRVINLMIHCSFSFIWVFLVFVYVFSLIILELLLASLIELLLKIFDDCGTIVPQGCLD